MSRTLLRGAAIVSGLLVALSGTAANAFTYQQCSGTPVKWAALNTPGMVQNTCSVPSGSVQEAAYFEGISTSISRRPGCDPAWAPNAG
jgi:hypothetical protein